MASVSENLFAALQERVLDPLKSDLTAAELHSSHIKSATVDERPDGSSSPPSTPSLDSDSDVLVYTHDDLVTSLAKQLQIQTRINAIYDRDLACRTQIIEELSVRITELESASRVRVEDEQVLMQLRTRVRKLERALYASQLVNKSLVGAVDAPEDWEGIPMPEGYSLVQNAWYEKASTGTVAWDVERENWKARVCALEAAVAALQEKEDAWRAQVTTSSENDGAVTHTALSEERQKLEEAFEAEKATLRTELTELSQSLEGVAEENARVCIRRCAAKNILTQRLLVAALPARGTNSRSQEAGSCPCRSGRSEGCRIKYRFWRLKRTRGTASLPHPGEREGCRARNAVHRNFDCHRNRPYRTHGKPAAPGRRAPPGRCCRGEPREL
jgi:hypothetical protein